jgi:hypothetical protein
VPLSFVFAIASIVLYLTPKGTVSIQQLDQEIDMVKFNTKQHQALLDGTTTNAEHFFIRKVGQYLRYTTNGIALLLKLSSPDVQRSTVHTYQAT